MHCQTFLIVVGALGTVPKGLEKNRKRVLTMISVELLQKTALFETAHILRRVWSLARTAVGECEGSNAICYITCTGIKKTF